MQEIAIHKAPHKSRDSEPQPASGKNRRLRKWSIMRHPGNAAIAGAAGSVHMLAHGNEG
ncbi:hypothetical protein DSCA_38210 [Desulfosarcina alkanivorans]|uniref:Uncharacterized protein n=1 Tax=Desulfosarcina alkanivorans TaxID=571177 RepID=A0A5K7YSD6_9BACT|nr:hypothetical protein DSCA_38210 [Desulfosarcina alkanivorans]